MIGASGRERFAQFAATDRPRARVCIPTWRRFNNTASRSGLYEAQDVFASLDEVDILPLESEVAFEWKQRWQRRLIWRDFTKRLIHVNPGIKPMRLTQDYDLLIVMCNQWYELAYLNAIQDWRSHCKVAICWLNELWANQLLKHHNWLHALDQFDHVLVSASGTVSVLSELLGRQCYYMPLAVDILRFSPYPTAPARVIDVLSIGRRWEGVHRALLELAKPEGIFYVHDTVVDGGDMGLSEVGQHRDMLANMSKRSRFFFAGTAKMGHPEETSDQVEFGSRYFEGTAAGSVLVGQVPDCEAFRTLFDWPEVIIPIKPDGSDVREVLRSLVDQPKHLRDISIRNAASCARCHDWMYRWQKILEIAGLSPTTALDRRAAQLEALAKAV